MRSWALVWVVACAPSDQAAAPDLVDDESVDTPSVDSPAPLEARISPRLVGPADTVRCEALDGTPAEVAWLVDGVSTGATAQLGPFDVGTQVSCTLSAGDRVGEASITVSNGAWGSNVLLLIVDDVSTEKVRRYGYGTDAPPTPALDRLAEEGVLFRNAYSNPVCSPTRATILTGQFSYRTGIGVALGAAASGLTPEALSLPELIAQGTAGAYSSAALGKWHLTGEALGPDGPEQHGFDQFAGTYGNLSGAQDYFTWKKVEDGVEAWVEAYATTDTVDDAIELTRTLPEPWLLWVGFHGAHTPFHTPPPDLHGYGPETADRTAADRHDAMVQSVDREIGRLMEAMGDAQRARTTIVWVGDNGTPPSAVRPPFDGERAKSTVYEGGVNVPLVIVSPMVVSPGRESTALVNTVDLFATLAEVAGVALPDQPQVPIDGVSMVPVLSNPAAAPRELAWAEMFSPNGRDYEGQYDFYRYALRDHRYTFISGVSGREELYDRATSRWSERNLIDSDEAPHRAAVSRLRAASMTRFRGALGVHLPEGSLPP